MVGRLARVASLDMGFLLKVGLPAADRHRVFGPSDPSTEYRLLSFGMDLSLRAGSPAENPQRDGSPSVVSRLVRTLPDW
jgi:hypothetical protein